MSRGPYTPDAVRLRTVKRVLTLWRFLDGRRTRPTLAVLATMAGCSTRTIRRDLALLEELHFAVPPERDTAADDDLEVLPARVPNVCNPFRRFHA